MDTTDNFYNFQSQTSEPEPQPESKQPPKRTYTRLTDEEKLEISKRKLQALQADINRLRSKAAQKTRKLRDHTFYQFSGEMLSDNWKQIRELLIESTDPTPVEVEILINGESVSKKSIIPKGSKGKK